MKRFSNTPVWNPNTTQDIRETLIEAGRQDLADGIVMQGIRNLEAKVAAYELRVQGIENAQRKEWTESAIVKIVRETFDQKTAEWVKWGVRAMLVGAAGAVLSLLALVMKFAWKGLHTT